MTTALHKAPGELLMAALNTKPAPKDDPGGEGSMTTKAAVESGLQDNPRRKAGKALVLVGPRRQTLLPQAWTEDLPHGRHYTKHCVK